jgi:GT2 family glycosyltransferase
VHNALADVRRCLESLLAHPSYRLNELLLVNDGSDESTTSYLHSFKTTSPIKITLLENPAPTGYTKAANRGLAASHADFVVLLNSDTIVTPGWIERLMGCAEADPTIGIIGPLSNAASWQSVPKRFAGGGDWAVNELDLSTLNRIATAYSASSQPQYPRVSIVNGFCIGIKRKVIDTIGLLDELSFPLGYGEENDYCLRAAQAGFNLAIADDCYVFHAKSKSYSHERRRQLAALSAIVLRERYGSEIDIATEALRTSPALAHARSVFSQVAKNPPVSVLFLMHFRGFGGGISSIVQEANGLKELGVAVQIAIRLEDAVYYRNRFPTIPPNLFFPFKDNAELSAHAGSFEIVAATLFTGVRLLQEILSRFPHVIPCYYIQDYEPNFFPPDDPNRKEALESYTLIPTLRRFAKTQWLCDFVAQAHNVPVSKVEPSLDRSVFFAGESSKPALPLNICAMVRPHTAHRSPALTFEILRQIKLEQGDRVEIQIFGLRPDNPFLNEQPKDFPCQVLGILKREEVADVFRKAFLFIDASRYQAFGRSGLEAMACGCATILPAIGGTNEYAVDGINTLLATCGDLEEVLEKARQYINDPELHSHIVKRGLETASRYSVKNASISELEFFKHLRPQPESTPTFGHHIINSPNRGLTRQNEPGPLAWEVPNAATVAAAGCDYKFRITILSSTTNIHGGTRRLLNIAQRLHLRGHQVTFVTHHQGRELNWFDLNAPLRRTRFDENTPLAEVEERLPDADILLTYGNNRCAQLLSTLPRRKGRKFLLFMHMGVHDLILDERNATLPDFCKLTTTTWIAQELNRLGATATPIGFGVDPDQFYPVAHSRTFRVGTLLHKDDWKRSADVIEAFKIVKQRLPQAQLVAFGQIKDPQLDVECEYHFDPSQEKLRDIYSSCSAWVTPSLWEGVGMCSVEAMLCKTPLITTDTGGSRDFCHEENSVGVEKQCPPSIALAIIHLLTHPGYAARLAERAYSDINEHSWDRSINLLESEFLRDAKQENPTVVANRKYELTIGIHAAENQSDSFARCLASVYQNTLSDFELIVIDDASDGETHARIRKAYEVDSRRLRYLHNRDPKGFLHSYNQVLGTARGRYSCLIDAAALFTPGWDRALIELFRVSGDIALIGPPRDSNTVDRKQSDELANGKSSRPSHYLAIDNQLIGRLGFLNEQICSPEEGVMGLLGRAQAAGYRCLELDTAGPRRQEVPAFSCELDAAEEKKRMHEDHFHTTHSKTHFAVPEQRIAFI